jgi:hypothetical protein
MMKVDYLDVSLPQDLKRVRAESEKPVPFLNYDPAEAPYQPASRLPFAMYSNDLVLVGAPRGFLTAFLIDQADRIRAAFRVPLPESKFPLHRFGNINRSGSRVVSIDTGEIFDCRLNPKYFIDRDPRLIVPLLHNWITHRDPSFPSLLSRDVLKVYWNGEVFNEMLLLEFNRSGKSGQFAGRVCSTFAKPRFFQDGISHFEPFDSPRVSSVERQKTVEAIYNFREIEQKAVEMPSGSGEFSSVCRAILTILYTPVFDARTYAKNIQFPSWLQITAIRASIVPLQHPVTIETSLFPEDLSPRILETWVSRSMLPIEHNWPEIETNVLQADSPPDELQKKAQRFWWYLRSEPVEMTSTSGGRSNTKMFEYVEQLTNKTRGGNQSGPILFSLHQYLLGVSMNKPICDL